MLVVLQAASAMYRRRAAAGVASRCMSIGTQLDADHPENGALFHADSQEGKFRSAAEVAEAEKVTRSFVNRLLRLTLLAPDIQEAIIDGRQPKGMQLEERGRCRAGGKSSE